MTESLPDSWRIFIEHYPQFIKLQRKLGALDWYVGGGWTMFVGHYHAGIFAQVFKPHWHNQTLDGIHIELGLDTESLATKQLRLDLHIGHRNLFDRVRFNELTVQRIVAVAATWDSNVQFSTRNLSDRLHVLIPFAMSRFPDQVAAGLTRVCSLGAVIDEGLAALEGR